MIATVAWKQTLDEVQQIIPTVKALDCTKKSAMVPFKQPAQNATLAL